MVKKQNDYQHEAGELIFCGYAGMAFPLTLLQALPVEMQNITAMYSGA